MSVDACPINRYNGSTSGWLAHAEVWVSKMRKTQALELLRTNLPELESLFGVKRLVLFGSTARDTATDNSDIDVMVEFEGPVTSARFFGVLFFLEDLFERPVDLVTSSALRSELKPHIENDMLNI